MLKKLIMTSTIIASSAAYAAGPVIVGGTEIHSNQYPFIVAVFNTSTGSNTEVDCAGTLVGKQWVLTASHCVSNMEEAGMPKVPAKDISIETRNANGTLNSSSRDQASQAIIYGNANAFQMEHDIALIKLAKPISNITPVKLPAANQPIQGDIVSIFGYGWMGIQSWSSQCSSNPFSYNCTFTPVVNREGTNTAYLHYGESTVISPSSLLNNLTKDVSKITASMKAYKQNPNQIPPYVKDFNSATMFGIQGMSGFHVSNGDSGGPALIGNVQTGFTEIGVNSWGVPPFSNLMPMYLASPSVEANLTNPSMLGFIKNTLNSRAK